MISAKLVRVMLLVSFLAVVSDSVADITVNGSVLNVTTDNTKASFQGTALIELRNLLTGENYIRQPGSSWIDMNLKEPTGETLRAGTWILTTDPNTGQPVATIIFQDSVRTVSMTVGNNTSSGEIFIRVSGRSSEPGVRSVFWGVMGVDLTPGRLLVPGQAGTYFDLNSPPQGAVLGLDYPVHWESQLVLYERNTGGFFIYARDVIPHFKRLIAARDTGTLDFGFETFANAPWANAVHVPEIEWRLKSFQGDWRVPTRLYREWIRSVWPMVEPTGSRIWVREIRAVVTVISPNPAILEALTTQVDPRKTLIYLVDWRRDPFDTNYPDYTHNIGTEIFVRRAHELGFRIMLHVNLLGVSTENPDFALVKDFQMKDPDTLELLFWPFALWPEGKPPEGIPAFAFISPASSVYRSLFISRLRVAVESLQPDAIHLDAGGTILNDGNGLIEGINSAQGTMQFYREIIDTFPYLVLSAESINEVTAPYNWLAQRWPADTPGHPIGTFLYGNQAYFYGYLDQPNPDEPNFTQFVKRYEGQGIMPTMIVNSPEDLRDNQPGVGRLIRQIRLWQQYDFQPDWDSDWQGVMFRYRSADGRINAEVEALERLVRLKVNDAELYRRVRNASQVETTEYITGWPAYDDMTLYGLDSRREYWLEPSSFRPADLPHLISFPQNLKLGLDTLVTRELAYFHIEPLDQPTYDFIAEFWRASKGTIYNGQDFPLMNGAQAIATRMKAGGELRNSVLFLHPPYRRVFGGATFVEYVVPIPTAPRVSFRFEVGLSDNVISRSDGVTFAVFVQGIKIWRKDVAGPGWTSASMNLSSYAGQSVRIRLVTAPGGEFNPFFDWSGWTNLRIVPEWNCQLGEEAPKSFAVVQSSSSLACQELSFRLVLPQDSEVVGSVGGVPTAPAEDRTTTVSDVAVPGRFILFLRPANPLNLGQSLLDLPFSVAKAGYGGLALPAQGDDLLVPAISGGVEMARTLRAYPPRNGRMIVSWVVKLSEEAERLEFAVGLLDGLLQYPGVGFVIRVNGKEIWQKKMQAPGWHHDAIDLSAWRGQMALIQLITDSLKENVFDLAHWAGLELHAVADFSASISPASATVPVSTSAKFNITLTSQNGFTDQITLTCLNPPAGVSCSFSLNPISLSANGTVTTELTVSVTAQPFSSLVVRDFGRQLPPRWLLLPFLGLVLALLLCRKVLAAERSKCKPAGASLALALVTLLAVIATSCGGGATLPSSQTVTVFLTIQARSATLAKNIGTVTVSVP